MGTLECCSGNANDIPQKSISVHVRAMRIRSWIKRLVAMAALLLVVFGSCAYLLQRSFDNTCISRGFGIERGMVPHSGARGELRAANPRFNPQWTPDGSRIVFSTGRRPSMEGPYTRDPSGDTPSAPDSEIAPSGQIYVAASDGSSLLLAADGKIEAYYRIAHSPTISPNGTRVAYSMLHDSTYGEAVFPYGSYLIETSNFDGSDRRRLTEGDVMDFSPTWSPEGSRIAFVRRKDRGGCDNFRQVGIHTIGDNGQDIRKVVDIPARNAEGTPTEWDAWYHSGPTWSSDGELLAYIVNEREESEDKRPGYFRDYARIHTTLYTVNADRSDLKRLLTFSSRGYLMPLDQQYVTPDEDLKRVGLFSEEPGRSIVSPPEWSPDGQHIAFVGIAEGVPKLYTIGRDGSDLHEIVELENPGIGGPEVTRTSPSVFWSRDGSQILFSWGRTLYFVNADGSDLNSIHGGDYFSPSPDGSRVAHFVDGAKVVLLFAMAPDGSGVRALGQGRRQNIPVGRSKSVPPERSLASVNVRASCSGEVSQRQAGSRLGE